MEPEDYGSVGVVPGEGQSNPEPSLSGMLHPIQFNVTHNYYGGGDQQQQQQRPSGINRIKNLAAMAKGSGPSSSTLAEHSRALATSGHKIAAHQLRTAQALRGGIHE